MLLKDYVQISNKFDYPEDITRIVKIMKDRGIEITPDEADELWNIYSDDLCAQWLGLPTNDNDIFKIIIYYAKRKYKAEE